MANDYIKKQLKKFQTLRETKKNDEAFGLILSLLRFDAKEKGVISTAIDAIYTLDKHAPSIAAKLVECAPKQKDVVPAAIDVMCTFQKQNKDEEASYIATALVLHAAEQEGVMHAILQYPAYFQGDVYTTDTLTVVAFNQASKDSSSKKLKIGFLAQSFAVSMAAPSSNRNTVIFDNHGQTMVADQSFYGTVPEFEKTVSKKYPDRRRRDRKHYDGVIELAHRFDKQKTPRPV